MSQDGFNLMTMDVSRNKIKKLSSSSFLASLQHINLQRNEIQYIAANTFTQLVHLQTVRWLPFTEHQKNINFLPKLNSVWLELLYNYNYYSCYSNARMQSKSKTWRESFIGLRGRQKSSGCQILRCFLFADWMATSWWLSTCPRWPPTPRWSWLPSSTWLPTHCCVTVTWTTSPGCGSSPRLVRTGQ